MSDVNEAATTAENPETATTEEAAEASTTAPASTEGAAAPATESGEKNIGNRVRHELADKIFFAGKTPATEGTTYGIMQAILLGHPDGLTAKQFTEATIEKSGDLFKKSTAFEANKERHVRGYLVGGIKRGFFTTTVDEAAADLLQKKRASAGGEKAPKAGKEPAKPRTSKGVIEILEAIKGQTAEDGRALVVKVAESMKKTLKNLSKGIASCVEQGLITEHKSESGELIALALTDKGRETLTPAPAPTTTEGAAAPTEGETPEGEATPSTEGSSTAGSLDTPF